MCVFDLFFFFKQKTAYEMRISDWSSDVCSSDLAALIVVARSGTDAATGRGRLTMLIVPADAPGLHFTRIETRVVSHERQFAVHFDDVRVPAAVRIGPAGHGLQAAFAGLTPERIEDRQSGGEGRRGVER